MAALTLDPRKLLFRPRGRLNRPSFAVGLVLFLVVTALAGVVMRALDPATGAGFYFGLFFAIAWMFMLYSVFGQRLHDMGKNVWPLTGVLALLFVLFISVAMAYGGAEYVDAYSEFERKDIIDPEVKAELDAAYEAELAEGAGRTLNLVLGGVMGAFTLWLLLTKGQTEANRYGFPSVE